MHFERRNMPFKMHKIIFFSRKKSYKKNMSTLPKIFRCTFFFYLAFVTFYQPCACSYRKRHVIPERTRSHAHKKVKCSPFITLCLGSIGMNCVISELCYNRTRTIWQVIRKWPFHSRFPIVPGKKREPQRDCVFARHNQSHSTNYVQIWSRSFTQKMKMTNQIWVITGYVIKGLNCTPVKIHTYLIHQ